MASPSVLSQLKVDISQAKAAKAQPTRTLPLSVVEYVINEKDPSKSFVKGIVVDGDDKTEIKVYLDSNGHKMTINGFQSLQDGHDPKFDYAVPVGGVIAFEGCKTIAGAENSYISSWAKGLRRKDNQTAHQLMTTMNIYPASSDRVQGSIAFNSYRPGLAQTVDLKSSKSPVEEVRQVLSTSLDPRRGPEGNLSLALLRIHNTDQNSNEPPVAIEIKGVRADNNHQPGNVAVQKWETSDLGKVIMNELLPNQLAGNDFVLEVIPGVRYFAAPNLAAPFFVSQEEAVQQDDETLVGKIKHSSFAAKLAAQLNAKSQIPDAEGNMVNVTQPKFVPMVLGTYIHDNGNSIVTYFKPSSTKAPLCTAETMPSPFTHGAQKQLDNTQQQTAAKQSAQSPAPVQKPTAQPTTQPTAEPAPAVDEDNLDLGGALSADEMEDLQSIAEEMRSVSMTPTP